MEKPNSSTSSFKRFILRLLLPITLCSGTLVWTTAYLFEQHIILQTKNYGYSKIHRMITEYHPDEIPLIGSSRIEGSLIPTVLGTQYYNYGIAGTQTNVQQMMLKLELAKQKQTPILLGLDLRIKNQTGSITNYLPHSTHPSVNQLVTNELSTHQKLPLIRYYGYFEEYLANYLMEQNPVVTIMQRKQIGGRFDRGAFLQNKKASPERLKQMIASCQGKTNHIEIDTTLLNQYLQTIRSTDRKIIILIAPYHPAILQTYRNQATIKALLDQFRAIPNVQLLDFSTLPLDDSQFFDLVHLNYDGAKHFSTLLRDTLNQPQ